MEHAIPAAFDEDVPARPVSGWFVFVLVFAQYAAWLAILTPVFIAMALKVQEMAPPAQKGAYLAAVLAPGAFCAMLAGPIWGAISDRTSFRFGRRRTWMVVGSLMLLGGLLTAALAQTLPALVAGWIVCQVGSNANQAAINAITPDFVPPAQRGRVSGFLGLTLPLAYVSGTFLTQFTSGNDLALFLAPWLPSIVAVPLLIVTVRDRPAAPRPFQSLAGILRGFWIDPRQHPDFAWAFTSRFLTMLAVSFATTYQVYFLTDQLGVAKDQVAYSMFLCTLVTAGLTIVLTPAAGWLADRTGRMKPFVYGPAVVVALGLLAISASTTFTHFIVAIAIVGVGKGIYFAVDFALCVSVLPSRDSAAKDLGILQIANSLPQSIAPTIAPLFLAIGSAEGRNYPAVFVGAMVIALCAAAAVLPIRKVR